MEGETSDLEASSWLAQLGLDRSKYKSLEPNKVKLQRDAFKAIDSKPESSVFVCNSDVTALFNFLLNSNSVTPIVGELAGVPPTLLAPCPFKGATITSLIVRQNALRQQQADGSAGKVYSLELIGPVLPSAFEKLCLLFESTQGKTFSCASHILDSSVALNATTTARPTMSEHLQTTDVTSTSGSRRTLPVRIGAGADGKFALRELQCRDGLYTWS